MAQTDSKNGAHGRLLRLRPLNPESLPSHPSLAHLQTAAEPPKLQAFIAEALNEASSFTTSYLSSSFKTKASDKQSPPSAAPVELLTHDIPGSELPSGSPEAWFARSSTHENAAKEGTASWEEFDKGTRRDHCLRENDYTPDVFDSRQVLSWDEMLESAGEGSVEGWKDVQMSIWEMCHQIPSPLKDRVFAVCCITAMAADEQSWLVLQIPVSVKDVQGTGYVGTERVQEGIYVSIERGDLVENGAKVRWQMATASDAKGALPMWAQKMGVPDAVVKDVGLFMDWIEKKRKGQA
ncbi:hypothetical protein MBLNU230_g0147t1 [Neophaeotheca triangularis]